MKRLRSIFLWVSGWIAFLAFAPFLVVLSYAVRGARLYRVIRPWARLVLWSVGIRVVRTGELLDPRNGPCLYAVPHVNLFDPFVLSAAMPDHVPGIELDSHFSWPLYGRLIRALDHLPISHTTPHAARASLRVAEDRLRDGHSLIVFPEGRRTRSGKRGEFGLWAFRVAARTGTPVQPLAFVGAFERHATEQFDIVPGEWRVVALSPIYPDGEDRPAAERLREAVVRAIDEASREGL